MFNRLEAIVFFVADIHAAANWYAQLLATEVQYENPQYAFIQRGGISIGFHPADAKCPGGVGGTTAYWKVDDLEQSIKVLEMNGAVLYRGPIQTDLGDHAAILLDPFGCTIGLHQVK